MSFEHPVLLGAAAVAGLGIAGALFCPSTPIAVGCAVVAISVSVGFIFLKRMQD